MMNRFKIGRINYLNISRQFQRGYRPDQEDRKRTILTVGATVALTVGAISLNYYISNNENEESISFFPKKPNDKVLERASNESELKQTVDAKEIYLKKENLPKHVPYVIIGTGASGISAAKAIRASDTCSKVLMIGSSPRVAGGEGSLVKMENGDTKQYYPPPYLRPPLSKQLWKRSKEKMNKLIDPTGDMREHSWIFYEPDYFFLDPEKYDEAEHGGVFLINGDPVVKLDSDNRKILLASGSEISFDFCLISTGARPKRLPSVETCSEKKINLVNIGKVSYFRTLSDFQVLRGIAENLINSNGKIAVIGGGFLGCEIATSLASLQESMQMKDPSLKENLQVVHLFRETAPMSQVLPPLLASTINNFESEEKGISIIASCDIVSAKLMDETGKVRIRYRQRNPTDGSTTVGETDVDHIVCAVGVEPNTDLAEGASLELDPNHGGYLVNSEMEARSGIYACGDVASYYDPVLGFRRRVEHLNFAEETGSIAGKNMVLSSLKLNKDSKDHTYSKLENFDAPEKYKYQSSTWSSLGHGVSWDAVGICDAKQFLTKSFFIKDAAASNSDDKSFVGPDVEAGKDQSISEPDQQDKLSQTLSRDDSFTKQGIVYYLDPRTRRIVGILLWNMQDEFFTDDEMNPPTRLNLARKFLLDKIIVSRDEKGEEELLALTKNFDLSMKIDKDYEELKRISKEASERMSKDKPDE